jgi:hypothetical protein
MAARLRSQLDVILLVSVDPGSGHFADAPWDAVGSCGHRHVADVVIVLLLRSGHSTRSQNRRRRHAYSVRRWLATGLGCVKFVGVKMAAGHGRSAVVPYAGQRPALGSVSTPATAPRAPLSWGSPATAAASRRAKCSAGVANRMPCRPAPSAVERQGHLPGWWSPRLPGNDSASIWRDRRVSRKQRRGCGVASTPG